MTEPVYDPRHQNFLFDRCNIEAWLAKSPTHPCTREPLKASDLVSENILEAEISDFVENTLKDYEKKNQEISGISLTTSAFWSSRLDDQYIIEHRGEHTNLQHDYDIYHGLAIIR